LPTNARVAIRDTVLPVGAGSDGSEPVFCPKGTMCRWMSWSTQRQEQYYGSEPDEFRPERWEGLKPTWEYTPFSGGPSMFDNDINLILPLTETAVTGICIGQQFAMTQIALVIVRLLQTFKTIEPADDRPLETVLGITVHLKNGCWLSMTPT
jgi:cytochrome P450